MSEVSDDRALGRIEGKLDAFIGELSRMRTSAIDLETRVRSLERARAWVIGAAAAAGAVLSKALNYLATGDPF